MRTIVRAACAASLVALAAGQSMAGSPAPKPVSTTTAMRVSVVGADNVVISDSEGRRYPCRDSTCRPIPKCHAVSGFGTRPRNGTNQSVPKLIAFEILGPGEGAYRIHAADADPHVTLTVDVSNSTMRCGNGDAIDGASGASHEWVVKWRHAEKDTSCVLTLTREKLRGKK
jgi:hypothetical protein